MRSTPTSTRPRPVLVLGGTGKTGRRVAQRLTERGMPVRIGARGADRPFDWDDPSTWDHALEGVDAVYIAYHPDLALPAAEKAIRRLVERATAAGVRRLVLLSGRGEPGAQRCERIVLDSGLEATVVRASWFAQNFSEGFIVDMVRGGEITLPAHAVREPFVDADDIADVAVAALTEDGHVGQVYEVTGPELLTFAEAVAILAEASGRKLRHTAIPHDVFLAALKAQNVPAEMVELLDMLFREVLDGRNEQLADGVQRALGRAPRSFASYARRAAATGVWEVQQA